MSESIDPRGKDNPSTYFVEDRSNDAEMLRLFIQDRLLTEGMGGPLTEQTNIASIRHALDLGCGPGGWVLETARIYPHMDVTGCDISWRMIEYANALAKAHHLTDGVSFRVMDALSPLEFPDASFDLVNVRLASSFMLAKDWTRLLHEIQRVTQPGGVIRITDKESAESTSSAYIQLDQMLLCALYKAGHHFAPDRAGLVLALPPLLVADEWQQVQKTTFTLDYVAGTIGGQNFYQNIMYGFQTLSPFLHKWGCASTEYDTLYEQALLELQRSDFHATWHMTTILAKKPE